MFTIFLLTLYVLQAMGDVTYFYKNYMDVKWTPASVATQFAQVVFITPQNASNYVVASNLTAVKDVNKIPFCSGMFSYATANQYAKTVCFTIKEAMTKYQEESQNDNGTTVVQQVSPADELKSLKNFLIWEQLHKKNLTQRKNNF